MIVRQLRAMEPEVRRVIAATMAVNVAVGIFGISFGVASVAAGADILQTCALSFFTFTGASQFSAMSVVGAGGSASAAFGGAAILAARNFVYGLAMSRMLHFVRPTMPKRLLAAHFIIDESTALASAESNERLRRIAFWSTALGLFIFWNLGTLLGALLGGAIDPEVWGLDVAFPAVFVAMLAAHLRTRRGQMAAALGALIFVVLVPVLPIGVPILAASSAVLVGAWPESRRRSGS